MNIAEIASLRFSNPGFEHIRSMTEQLEAAMNPLRSIMAEHEAVVGGIAEPFLRQVRLDDLAIKGIAEAYKPVLDELGHLGRFAGPLNSTVLQLGEELTAFNTRLQEATSGIPQRLHLFDMEWAKAVGLLEPLRPFGSDFVTEFNREMQVRLAAYDELDLREAEVAALEESLLDWIIAWLNQLPGSIASQVTARAVLAVVFSLLLTQVPNVWDRRTANRDRASLEKALLKLEEHQEKLRRCIIGLCESAVQQGLFVVQRDAPLRVAPHGKARRARTVPQCSLVRAVQVQGHWLEVTFLDNANGEAHSGWVYRRWVRELTPDEADDTCGEPEEQESGRLPAETGTEVTLDADVPTLAQ